MTLSIEEIVVKIRELEPSFDLQFHLTRYLINLESDNRHKRILEKMIEAEEHLNKCNAILASMD